MTGGLTPGTRIRLCDGVVFEVLEIHEASAGDGSGGEITGKFSGESAVYTFQAAEVLAFSKGFPIPSEVAELVRQAIAVAESSGGRADASAGQSSGGRADASAGRIASSTQGGGGAAGEGMAGEGKKYPPWLVPVLAAAVGVLALANVILLLM